MASNVRQNFYTNRGRIKWVVAAVALAISAVSLWYTSDLVRTLQDREKKLISLLAKAYKVIGSSDFSENQTFLFMEIIETNNSVPVILTDDKGQVMSHRNLNLPKDLSQAAQDTIIARELAAMKEEYEPIEISVPDLRQFIYYRNSDLIRRLQYYPYLQLGVIGVFAVMAYLAFSYSRNAEQNRVWVGLAKETAHQLGTPLSSLMAWVEYFKADDKLQHEDFVEEIEKDVHRLQTVTHRFSQIGSVPVMKEENVVEVVTTLADYLRKRISTKVQLNVRAEDSVMQAGMNRSLFEWVIENLVKNAVDAMAGNGRIDIEVGRRADARVFVEVADNGKGMTKKQQRRVFDAGYTTKKRGWGLGLTLSKRIMENYHRGRIYVKRSEAGQGATFRVVV